ncbi:hypothetical protein GCM10012275_51420 [Longimycelium tulufanense]|uniref:Uncharacterized protein n=1 Tax=Longimycelium tulufanense TaxID=907463 RepID=A0A8J3FWU5_9PSEU|nr:hypothetical protein GCM10012275_51420 [Longimycelium tulufanense]
MGALGSLAASELPQEDRLRAVTAASTVAVRARNLMGWQSFQARAAATGVHAAAREVTGEASIATQR